VCAFAVPSKTIFKPLPLCPVCKYNRFPFVLLNVWSFNLHQKRNSVTASLFFAALLGLSAINFPLWLCLVCAFASSKRDRFLIL